MKCQRVFALTVCLVCSSRRNIKAQSQRGHEMNVSFPITTTTTILRYFFRDHPGEPVPEENFWTLCCNGRLTEADTPTIWLGATPSGITSAHLHHPPLFTGWMPFLPTNQQHQSTEGKSIHTHIQPFSGPFSGNTRVSRCQRRTSGLYGARED